MAQAEATSSHGTRRSGDPPCPKFLGSPAWVVVGQWVLPWTWWQLGHTQTKQAPWPSFPVLPTTPSRNPFWNTEFCARLC